MSNTQVNNPPEPTPPGASNADPDPDEPSGGVGGLSIEILWDDALADWPERHRLTDAVVRETVEAAANSMSIRRGEVGVRLTDDSAIHQINARHLQHDYATDVISFLYRLDAINGVVEGELVASLETARDNVIDSDNWDALNELRLYVVHGVLHLCGMDDHTVEQKSEMRRAEARVLSRLGLDPAAAMEGFSE